MLRTDWRIRHYFADLLVGGWLLWIGQYPLAAIVALVCLVQVLRLCGGRGHARVSQRA
jgi:hypothetical protein